MNDIIYKIPNIFDIEKIQDIVQKEKHNIPIADRPHQRFVSDNEYLTELRSQYFWLSDRYNIYRFRKNLRVHVDSNRKCCINIPLSNNTKSVTKVYKKQDTTLFHDSKRVLDVVEVTDEPIFQFELTHPILFNTTYPHAVELLEQGTRLSMSWSISKDYTFDDIKDILSAS